MDYLGEAIEIGTLHCRGFLWDIDLVGMHLWHLTTHINYCMDVSLYS